MEISGAAVLRRSPMFAAAGGGFSDEGHVRYYVQPVRCGGGKKEEKRKAKLVKELSKDLSKFYSIGFGAAEGGGAADDVKGKMMSEAADLLLSQLKQLKAEEKESKRKRKEQKAAMKQAKKEAKMLGCNSEDSSSSSSESSCSECESVGSTSNLRKSKVIVPRTKINAVPVATESCSAAALSNPKTNIVDEPITPTQRDDNAVAERIEVFMGHQTPTERYNNAVAERIEMFMGGKWVTEPIAIQSPTERLGNAVSERIEVCMGGKCKKAGAVELMAEFEKMVGIEGAVVGCKCMGKCKDGPNVRVTNGRVSANPLCIGVGLEDVGSIVASFLGEEGGGVLGCLN